MDDLGFVKYCASSHSDIHICHKPGPGNEFEFEPVCPNQMCFERMKFDCTSLSRDRCKRVLSASLFNNLKPFSLLPLNILCL